jgi:hypothetical protein
MSQQEQQTEKTVKQSVLPSHPWTVALIAAELKVSTDTVRNIVKSGILPAGSFMSSGLGGKGCLVMLSDEAYQTIKAEVRPKPVEKKSAGVVMTVEQINALVEKKVKAALAGQTLTKTYKTRPVRAAAPKNPITTREAARLMGREDPSREFLLTFGRFAAKAYQKEYGVLPSRNEFKQALFDSKLDGELLGDAFRRAAVLA